jgi:hypothetical protein
MMRDKPNPRERTRECPTCEHFEGTPRQDQVIVSPAKSLV